MAKDKNEDGPAVAKRVKISKTQQEMLLIVLVASLVLGICLVLGVYFVKMIKFNSKVIDAKDDAIAEYEKTIKNIGLCRDTNNDGKYSDEELRKCNPDDLDSASLPGTLRYNVMVDMAQNSDLESVARDNQKDCYDENGDALDFQALYDETADDAEQAKYLAMLKMCSALRVIPDALPAQVNEEALMSSLNQIFILSGWEPESLSPSGNAVPNSEGVSTIPVSLTVEADSERTLKVLSNIEKSIRTFDLSTATIAWSGNNYLTLQAQGSAYYTANADIVETTRTVYASDKAAQKKKGTSK